MMMMTMMMCTAVSASKKSTTKSIVSISTPLATVAQLGISAY